MLRTNWQCSAAAVVKYLSITDYYATSPGQLLGTGYDNLDISNKSARDVFECLAHNINPGTGELLRPHAKEGQRVGMDFTFNSSKSVGIARELAGKDNQGDPRIEEAHREAVAYAMKLIEADMQTRVRVGGANDNRTTGNLMAYRVTHRDTRINADDQKPDMSLHEHVLVINATYDKIENKWKAAELGQIKHDAPFYEAAFHNRLASNLRDLGYGIRRKGKGFEIEGVSDALITKFSRRGEYIKKVAAKLGITNPETLAKLGATTRLGKTKELADDLNAYYVSRLTAAEKKSLSGLKGKPSYVSNDKKAVEYAIGHLFERNSVVEERKLYETAIRFGIGSVTPEGIQNEAKRQGMLLVGKEATTQEVLEQEGRIIRFAREGRGTMRPLGLNLTPSKTDLATLSPEQQALCKHIWESTDRIIMIEGDAGTGKTQTMQRTIPGIDKPGVFLAPSASASRGTLREKGFTNADTIARFNSDEQFREKARDGYIYIDEAPLAGLKDIDQVFAHAQNLGARIIIQGDRKQHKSVARGNLFEIMDKYAGLPIGRLKENWRQTHKEYKKAVSLIAKGDIGNGYDILEDLGWVKQDAGHAGLVKQYFEAMERDKSVLVVAPTHQTGDEITAAIRSRLKEEGKLGEEQTVKVLRPLYWTDAQKADSYQYDGTEFIQYHRNSGKHRAGERLDAKSHNAGGEAGKPGHFAVYREEAINLAPGDRIRITAAGKTLDGKRLDNGDEYTIKRIGNDIEFSNGYKIDKNFGHLTHAYVSTSYGSQGQTKDRVLIAMNESSLPAINAAQWYVSVSRGRERAEVFTDMAPADLRAAIHKADVRKSATELIGERPDKAKTWKKKVWAVMRRMKNKLLRDREPEAKTKAKEIGYER